MRAVIQRVKDCHVYVEGRETGRIEKGLLVYLGVSVNDSQNEAAYLAEKICNLRIFEDQAGKMNLSVKDVNEDILVVSQFTLYADTRKGRRPSYSEAALPEKAVPLYSFFISEIVKQGIKVQTGEFGASMEVSYVNRGPVTIILDSNKIYF